MPTPRTAKAWHPKPCTLTAMLQALIELREVSIQALAQRIGLPDRPILTAALERLISLNYVTKRDETTGAIYRPVAQAM